uniref:ferritin light chain-like n=1 Tax=Jaculus jaculus TaxID=51337 RepID=UPI0003333BE8|nr:ferritin light chain-like [Jaculus jaculus]
MASEVHQNYSTEVEAAGNRLVSLHLRASSSSPLPGLLSRGHDVAVPGVGHFSRELAQEKRLGMQSRRRSSRMCRRMCTPEWESPGGRRSLGTGENRTRLFGSSTRTDPHLCDFLEHHFLDEEEKRIRKMEDLLTSCADWSPRP